jgi:predicted phage baseplate assembly protein
MNCSCGCCIGPHVETPGSTANRPGLSKLTYRAGTHATFVQTMQARLSSADFPALDALRTRDRNDASIALLDAWAITGDVLTFYQERIVNEGYLRTATERRSVLELARLIGYTPKPGVAASVYLAYMIDKDAAPVEIPAGARVNSVPAPGEQMQAFEASESLKARFEWNVMRPRLTRPQTFRDLKKGLYFAGVATNLKPNDPLLLWLDSKAEPKPFRVKEVEVDAVNDRTHVLLQGVDAAAPIAIKAIGQVIEKFSNLEAFDVSATTATAKQVLNVLNGISAEAADSANLGEHLETVALPQLEQLLSISQERGYTKLAPWIEGMVGELREAYGASVSELGLAPNSFATPAGSNTVSALGGVMASIAAAPSKTPASARQLPRDADHVLANNADALPRLVTALRPELDALYTAWGNLPLSPEAGVSVCALRVQAPPFGHNAPLHPVLDADNKVVGHDEWKLASVVATALAIGFSDNVVRQVWVMAARGSEQAIANQAIEPSNGSTRTYPLAFGTLASGTLTVDYGDVGKVKTIAVEVPKFGPKIALNFEKSSPVLVSINGEEKVVGSGESPPPFDVDGAQVSIVFTSAFFMVSSQTVFPFDIVDLDTVYDKILPESWAVIRRDDTGTQLVARIQNVGNISRADYGITGRVTRLKLDRNWLTRDDTSLAVLRGATVSALCEKLPLAEEPLEDAICAKKEDTSQEIELGALYSGLEPGRWVIVAGERADIKDAQGNIVGGVKAAELQMISGVEQKPAPDLPGDKAHTFITFFDKLAYCYRRDTLAIYGNIVKATHGETRQEVLGGGNAAAALQQFTLKQPPLTFVSAPTVSGVQSSLVVRVNDVQWHESERFSELGPTDHKFITRTDDDAKTTIVFGDGEFGARVPTGLENIKATYRNGLGKMGNVKAGQITLLSTRPLGVKEVLNPIRASGGADRENRDQIRKNAPLALLALDRLVSTSDYADFARTFAGIGKAAASRQPTAHSSVVQVIVAGADDAPIETSSDLYRNLEDALHRFGDPHLPIEIAVRKRLTLIMAANVEIDPDYQWETLEPKIRAALLEQFSFDNRELGQPVLRSSAIATIQKVRGVVYVDIDKFDSKPEEELVDAFQNATSIDIGLQQCIAVEPNEIAYLVPDVAETLILQELKP